MGSMLEGALLLTELTCFDRGLIGQRDEDRLVIALCPLPLIKPVRKDQAAAMCECIPKTGFFRHGQAPSKVSSQTSNASWAASVNRWICFIPSAI